MTLRNLNFYLMKAKNNKRKWINPDRKKLKFKTSSHIQNSSFQSPITLTLATWVKPSFSWWVVPQVICSLLLISILKQKQNWMKLILRIIHRKFHKFKLSGFQNQLASQLTLPRQSKGHTQVGKCEKMNKDEVFRAFLLNNLLKIRLNSILTKKKKMLIQST
jgi:hypothetical protein